MCSGVLLAILGNPVFKFRKIMVFPGGEFWSFALNLQTHDFLEFCSLWCKYLILACEKYAHLSKLKEWTQRHMECRHVEVRL
jgi:hypothetical protein